MRLHGPRHFAAATVAVLFGAAGCLSPEEALRETDEEAADIVAEKQTAAFGAARPFDVRTPADRVAAATVDPETGLATRPAPIEINLRTAFELAAKNSREYQDQKERLWRAALALIDQRERFRPFPFFQWSTTATRDHGTGDTFSADAELGVTKVLESGGTFALSAGGNFLRFLQSPSLKSAASFLSLAVSIPLLRGAGEEIALENLRQEERNVIYALRDFERFKQTFAVRIESDYLRLLTQAKQIQNEERNLENVAEARRRNEALAEAQRLTQIEVDQARQDELRAQNRVIQRRDAFDGAVDAFKTTLGIPVDLSARLDSSDLTPLEALLDRPFGHEERSATARGLRIRLDLQNIRDRVIDADRRIRVAEDALGPDLTLLLNADPSSDDLKPFRYDFGGRYSASLAGDLGLDRDAERVALRRAHFDRAASLRDVEEFSDDVKRAVREALRTLSQRRESYSIQKLAVAVAERRRESVIEFRNRGDATTRDLLEAQEALVTAENALADALVEFRIAYLGFYRDTGALIVRPEGLDHETSDALLAAP
jgi:outer membrane protein TolC